MTTFRVHLASGAKIDIDAETPAAAGKIAADRQLGHIAKIKRVKESSNG